MSWLSRWWRLFFEINYLKYGGGCIHLWRPIETAPRDQAILAGFDSYDCGWSVDVVWWSEKEGIWRTDSLGGSHPNDYPYTHWMPVPDAPNNRRRGPE